MIAQLITILKKDLKLLMRSKSSTAAVLLGPLVVILLVGLVFSNVGEPEIVIGAVEADFDNADIYLESLNDAFTVLSFGQEQECVQSVRRGTTVACVVLEEGNPPKARIHVDPSDINVVYAVIDRVTGQLDEQSTFLREGFATSLLDSVTKSTVKLGLDVEQLQEANALLEQQEERSQSIAQDLRNLQIDVRITSRSELQQVLDSSINARDDLLEFSRLLLDEYEDLAQDVNDSDSLDDLEIHWDFYTDIADDVTNTDDDVFTELLADLEDVSDEIEESREDAQALASQAQQMRSSLQTANNDVGAVLNSITQVQRDLSTLDISRGDIVNPIEPVIEPVVTQDDSFSFVFPYFVTLIIMFTAVLLASTIIVRERQSSAFFRNFAVPLPDWIFVVSTFCTTVMVVLMQLIIISLVAAFFTSFSLLSNIWAGLLTLFIIVTFFSTLGMLIGYIFKSQEAVMLAAIAVSSLLLFISDLVLPAETLPGAVQFLVNGNPLVLSAELLKTVLLFGFGIGDIAMGLVVLLLYVVILFTAILFVQRLARARHFELSGAPERIQQFIDLQEIVEGKELAIGEWVVTNIEELVRALQLMDDEEYEKYASHRHNAIADWVLDVYKDEKLARNLKNKSRKGAINVLEKVNGKK